MYESLGPLELKTGENVEVGAVRGPDLEWADRVEALLGHKEGVWNWQNSTVVREEVGIDVCFYLLHRDGEPFANILTATCDGVGHFGHVWTKPEDRRKGAASRLMGLQMEQFRRRGGRALFLGTGYDTPPYHIYAAHGFVGLERLSGSMEYYTTSKGEFESEYFARGPTAIEDVQWKHWPASGALFLGDWPGVVRCVSSGLLARKSTEHPFLQLIYAEEKRRESGENLRTRVLFQQESNAVVGLALWDWDSLWPETCMVDIFCHPHYWREAGLLLDSLALPAAERFVAYADDGCGEKGEVLEAAGFRQTGRYEKRVAVDRARTDFVDVAVWEK